jgi:hypothetical protein
MWDADLIYPLLPPKKLQRSVPAQVEVGLKCFWLLGTTFCPSIELSP